MTVRGSGISGFAKGRAYVVKDCGQKESFESLPDGSILVVKTMSLSDSVNVDFKKVSSIVAEVDDKNGQVCLIAKGTGVPAIVGVSGCTDEIVTGDRVIIMKYDVFVNPDLETVNRFEQLRSEADSQLSLDL